MKISVPFGSTLIAALLLSSVTLADEVSEPAFLRWAGENALQLDSLDWRAFDPQLFSALDDRLEGKRVVYPGEADHFVAQRMEFRLILIRYLMEKGFRNIGMEMGISDGRRMDRYVETGDPQHLRRVGLYGHAGDKRYDRDDSVEGWTDEKYPEFGELVRDEGRWFLGQLRELNRLLPPDEPRSG